MNDSLFFATFDPLYVNAPDACSLCIAQPPAFNYEYCIEQNDGKRHYIKGFCCTACADGLLQKLAGREAQEWAEEEAELEAGEPAKWMSVICKNAGWRHSAAKDS